MKKNKYLILAVLVALGGLLLRLWHLGSIPPSLHWDEASLGYNAFSIFQTGRDEYGNLFPLLLKSFGDFKPALYVYTAVLTGGIFGFSEFSVRLPSALFGGASILLLFLVVGEIFKDRREGQFVALISAVVLATSPWHFHYSHGAWEVNALLFFLLLGIFLFLRATKNRLWLFLASIVSFGLCFYVYQSAKFLVPLVILGLVLSFKGRLPRFSLRTYLISLAVLGVMVLPIANFTLFGGAGGRLKVMSIFSYDRSLSEAARIADGGGITPDDPQFAYFHGSLVYFGRGVLGRYLNHFSGRFLFFEGDYSNLRHGVGKVGVLNLMAIFFLPLGAFFLISKRVKNQVFFWYLLLLAPLPAALTRDVVQATRSFLMVLPLAVITACGIWAVLDFIKKFPLFFRWGVILILVSGWSFSFAFYLDQFFTHAPIAYSADWLYGYKQAVSYVNENAGKYERVVFTQKYGQPYIYYLFYTQYDPVKYQSQAKLIEGPDGDVGRVEKIDNISFRDIYWPGDRSLGNTLFVGGPYELPDQDIVEGQSKLLKEIRYLNGEAAFKIVETFKFENK